MSSVSGTRSFWLSYEDVSRFYPPGTAVELDSSLKAGTVKSHEGDGWIWVAEIPGNDLRLRKTYDLNPCLSRGMWVLVRSKHTPSRPYKIARISETSPKNRTVTVKLMSGISLILSRPCLREIIPFHSSHADLVTRLTGSEIPAAFFAAPADPGPANREAAAGEPAEKELPPKVRHVRDREGKNYPYLLYPDGRIGWFGFQDMVGSSPEKRRAPAAGLQDSIRKKKYR